MSQNLLSMRFVIAEKHGLFWELHHNKWLIEVVSRISFIDMFDWLLKHSLIDELVSICATLLPDWFVCNKQVFDGMQ